MVQDSVKENKKKIFSPVPHSSQALLKSFIPDSFMFSSKNVLGGWEWWLVVNS